MPATPPPSFWTTPVGVAVRKWGPIPLVSLIGAVLGALLSLKVEFDGLGAGVGAIWGCALGCIVMSFASKRRVLPELVSVVVLALAMVATGLVLGLGGPRLLECVLVSMAAGLFVRLWLRLVLRVLDQAL